MVDFPFSTKSKIKKDPDFAGSWKTKESDLEEDADCFFVADSDADLEQRLSPPQLFHRDPGNTDQHPEGHSALSMFYPCPLE